MRWVPLSFVFVTTACTQAGPPVPGASYQRSQVFADTVLAYSEGGDLKTCSLGAPDCNGNTGPTCGPQTVLGPADGNTFSLEAMGRLELGVLCDAIIENGGLDSQDFRIVANVPPGGEAVVEVSFEGNTFYTLTTLSSSNQTFDLAFATDAIQVARYVRISDLGDGGIEIDAIESLVSNPSDSQ